MSATFSATSPDHAPLPPEARAAALWTFIKAHAPRITFESAVSLIDELNPRPGEDHKVLAKRLSQALKVHGIKLKHTNALQAIARLTGHSSWHTDTEPPVPRLRFTAFDTSQAQESNFASWVELATALRAWSDKLHARGQLPLGILTLNFSGRILSLTTPVPIADEQSGKTQNETWPLGAVTPLFEDEDWLMGTAAAIEKLRRHLEENGIAVVDGCAVLQLCANSHDRPGSINAVTAADVVNSELVLLREDNEDDPHSGYEIARGDELTCWHQLELSLRDDRTGVTPAINVTIPTEGTGAWFVNGIRYVWALETLKPNEYVPGRVHRQIGISDCERLLRRYKMAKRIHTGTFKHHDLNKRIEYLAGPPQSYRVDLHHVLHLLKKAGLTWEGYIEQFAAEPQPMQAQLPAGFVLELLKNLQVEKPNDVFARPNLSEMMRVDDDNLLRSLMPRINAVRYVRPKTLDDERAQTLHKVADIFASALHTYQLVASNALSMEHELPYLVYASDAEEFLGSVGELGLILYAAVIPQLFPIPEQLTQVPEVKAWPWAFGHALFVRFEIAGDAQ